MLSSRAISVMRMSPSIPQNVQHLQLEVKNNETTFPISYNVILRCHTNGMCGVEGKRRLCDLNVTSSSPALATRHIRIVLLVNSPDKLNLLSWLLIYLCNK